MDSKLFDAAGNHLITVDEERDLGGDFDLIFQGLCTCGWSADRWEHTTDYRSDGVSPYEATDMAEQAAWTVAKMHSADVTKAGGNAALYYS